MTLYTITENCIYEFNRHGFGPKEIFNSQKVTLTCTCSRNIKCSLLVPLTRYYDRLHKLIVLTYPYPQVRVQPAGSPHTGTDELLVPRGAAPARERGRTRAAHQAQFCHRVCTRHALWWVTCTCGLLCGKLNLMCKGIRCKVPQPYWKEKVPSTRRVLYLAGFLPE